MKFLFLIAWLFMYIYANSQINRYERLYEGQYLPIDFLRHFKTAERIDMKGKNIVLDFWSITCKSCITAFPELNKLQETFKDNLQIVLVTWNTKEEISQFKKRSPIVQANKLPIMYSDSLLGKVVFPHNTEPYQVWINKEGQIKATLTGASCDSANLAAFISEKPFSVDRRNDLMDKKIYEAVISKPAPLAVINNGMFCRFVKYTSTNTISGKNENMSSVADDVHYKSWFLDRLKQIKPVPASGIDLYDSIGRKIGKRFLNKPLQILAQYAFDSSYLNHKIILGTGINLSKIPSAEEESSKFLEWYGKDNYCYEVFVTPYNESIVRKTIAQDIQRFFGITGKVEKRNVKCLVLFRLDDKLKFISRDENDVSIAEDTKTSDGIILRNVLFQQFLEWIAGRNSGHDDPIIIDETNIPKNLKISMRLHLSSLKYNDRLKSELKRYGIGIKMEEREQEVLVLKKYNY